MAKNDIPFFNLHTSYDEEVLNVDNEDTVLFRDLHFNEKGNSMAAEFLLPFENELLNMHRAEED